MLSLEKIQKLKMQFDGNDALVFAVAAVLLVLPYLESLKNIFLGLMLLVFVYCYFKKSGVRLNCPHFARQIFDQSGVQACRTTASLYCLGER